MARRELARLDTSRATLREVLPERSRQPSTRPRRSGRLRIRLSSAPAASAAAALLALAVISAVVVATGNRQAPAAPKRSLTLPADNQIGAILASYGKATQAQTPATPAAVPPLTILPKLTTTAYTMRPGDTLSVIAQKMHVSVGTLISFNGITDVRRLTAGTRLEIPDMNGILYRVQKGDTLEGIAKHENVKLSNILDANTLKSSVIVPGQQLFLPGGHMSSFAYRKALGTLFVWPTSGVITSPFGMRHDPFTGTMEFHNGIDIANSLRTPVDAAMSGTVALVGRNRGYGNFIILDNGNGFQTLYGHLFKSLVKTGEQVSGGQEIALMGDTGYATGPHLHFTIYKNSIPVNPLLFLPKR